MPDADDLDDALRDAIAKPASTSIEGNSVTRRSPADIIQAKKSIAADTAAASLSGGVKRSQFRHRGPAGGPTQ